MIEKKKKKKKHHKMYIPEILKINAKKVTFGELQ